MTVAAVTMVKDEADVIFDTLSWMSRQVDFVIAADNGSTDGTREAMEQLPNVTVVDDPEPAYYQSAKMSALAERAGERGAKWVVPFDADEIWLPREGTIAGTLEALPSEALVAEAALFDHVATGQDLTGPPVRVMRWRRSEAAPLRKVAVRYRKGIVIHQGNHGASFPKVQHVLSVANELEVRHFPYRSPAQMIRKARNGAAAYAASDLPNDVGAHWRGYGRLSDEQLTDVFHKWFFRAEPDKPLEIEGQWQPPLVFDPAPVGAP